MSNCLTILVAATRAIGLYMNTTKLTSRYKRIDWKTGPEASIKFVIDKPSPHTTEDVHN